jgi:glycine cleavage system pyridoxal-binding protein P
MSSKVTRRDLVERQQANLVNHYLSLEVTAVSVALAIAGFAATSLITDPITQGADLAVLWLLWAAGTLGIAAIYAGPMIGAFALPRQSR